MTEFIDIAFVAIVLVMAAGFVSDTIIGLVVTSGIAASITVLVVLYWSVFYYPSD